MRKRITSLFLALVLCAGLCLPASAEGLTRFTDVAPGSAFEEAIAFAVEQCITLGTTETTFSPNNPCTISHILVFLVRWFNGGFTAEDERVIALDLVAELQDSGLSIDPDDLNVTCTRIMAVRIIAAFAGAEGYDSSSAQGFTDLPSDAASQSAIAFAVDNGITTGTSATTFSPNSPCTRGQIVTFLFRAISNDIL